MDKLVTRKEKFPTRRVFVGREQEKQQFLAMQADSRTWLMVISCASGSGKTALLEQFFEISQNQQVLCSRIISFSSSAHQQKLGILMFLRDSLGAASFNAFTRALAQYNQLIASYHGSSNQKSRHKDIIEAERHAVREFVNECAALAKNQKPVLLFDTFEMIKNKALGSWFLSEFLPMLKEYATVVIAGQDLLSALERARLEQPIIPITLTPLSDDEIRIYFALAGENVPEEVAKRIITVSKGRPLIVALAVDWLRVGFSMHDFLSYDPATMSLETWLAERLVAHFQEMRSVEYLAILKMVHVCHRFDGEILMELSEGLDESGAAIILGNLVEYSFINHGYANEENRLHDEMRQIPNEYRLHDEMRQMLVEYVWDKIDLPTEERRKISGRMIMYYNRKLSFERSKPATDQDPRWIETLTAERLYHLLYNKRRAAYSEFWLAVYNAWNAGNFDFGDALLNVADQVQAQSSGADTALEPLIKLGRALFSFARMNLDEAIQRTDELIADPKQIKFIAAGARWIRGLCLQYREQELEAIQSFLDALNSQDELQRSLLGGDPLPQEHGIATLSTVQPMRLILLNALGASYRFTGRFDSALKYYTDALEQSRAVGDKVWEASALINLSQTHRWLGHYQDALDFAHLSLYLRRQLGLRLHEAISHNILGMLARDIGDYEQAHIDFSRALEIFTEAQSKWRLGMIYRNLGRLYHREHNYKEADTHYRQAHQLFTELKIRTEFPDLLHKMGLLEYTFGDIDQARQLFEQGLDIARSLDYNLYIVNCLVDLSQIAFDTNEFERIDEYARNVKALEANGYRFNPAYARMEFILGDIDLRSSQFDPAFDHYASACRYLGLFNERHLAKGLGVVRDKLLGLPADQRKAQARRLEQFWRVQPDLAAQYPAFIMMCQRYSEDL